MQSTYCRIWTRVTVNISYNDNHYTTGNFRIYIYIYIYMRENVHVHSETRKCPSSVCVFRSIFPVNLWVGSICLSLSLYIYIYICVCVCVCAYLYIETFNDRLSVPTMEGLKYGILYISQKYYIEYRQTEENGQISNNYWLSYYFCPSVYIHIWEVKRVKYGKGLRVRL